ncbi:phage major tail tube protein [Salinisphaera orenii]|uniref:phage major tail tube protein n=1 Tax=Salinisphaera orenii TaxID=856731 RepID=UPI000DBE2132
MPKVKDYLRDVTAFIDGRSYAGQCNQATLPSLQLQTEEMRAGGMDTPKEVDMGLQAMEASFQFASVPAEVMKLFGKENVDFKVRGWLKTPGGDDKGAVATMTGRIKTDEPGDWAPGSVASKTVTVAVDTYKLEVDGETVHDIDSENYKRVIDGVDMLEKGREFLGIG